MTCFGINPPKFAVGNNVRQFFQRFEAFIAIYNRPFTQEQTVNLIASLLCNRSFAYFNSLSHVTKQNYNETKRAIIISTIINLHVPKHNSGPC